MQREWLLAEVPVMQFPDVVIRFMYRRHAVLLTLSSRGAAAYKGVPGVELL
jgi:hypothetical protein